MKLYLSSTSSAALLLVVISTLSDHATAFRPIAPGPLFRGLRLASTKRVVVVNPLVGPSSLSLHQTHRQPSFSRTKTSVQASTMEAPPSSSSSSNSTLIGGSWECNENAECVEVPQCTEEVCRTSLDVRIHGEWFDLTGTCIVVTAHTSKVGTGSSNLI